MLVLAGGLHCQHSPIYLDRPDLLPVKLTAATVRWGTWSYNILLIPEISNNTNRYRARYPDGSTIKYTVFKPLCQR